MSEPAAFRISMPGEKILDAMERKKLSPMAIEEGWCKIFHLTGMEKNNLLADRASRTPEIFFKHRDSIAFNFNHLDDNNKNNIFGVLSGNKEPGKAEAAFYVACSCALPDKERFFLATVYRPFLTVFIEKLLDNNTSEELVYSRGKENKNVAEKCKGLLLACVATAPGKTKQYLHFNNIAVTKNLLSLLNETLELVEDSDSPERTEMIFLAEEFFSRCGTHLNTGFAREALPELEEVQDTLARVQEKEWLWQTERTFKTFTAETEMCF